MIMEAVLIESYDDSDRVHIIPYEDSTSTFGLSTEIITNKQAFSRYEVVGELINGEVCMFNDKEEEEYEEISKYLLDDED